MSFVCELSLKGNTKYIFSRAATSPETTCTFSILSQGVYGRASRHNISTVLGPSVCLLNSRPSLFIKSYIFTAVCREMQANSSN